MKSKKILMIIISVILVILIIIGIIVLGKNKKEIQGEEENKTAQIYQNISNATDITFERQIDDENKIITIIKGDKAYKEIVKNGKTTKYIVKDGNTYYLNDSNKQYYEYKNNTTILSEIKVELEKLKETTNVTDVEKINGKEYRYEEFEGYQYFLINTDLQTNNGDAKTRLYYDNDKLVYIKTIVGQKEEISKVELKYTSVNDDYFEIPEDYSNGI